MKFRANVFIFAFPNIQYKAAAISDFYGKWNYHKSLNH